VIAGKSILAFKRDQEGKQELSGRCFAWVQTYDEKPKRRLFELLKSQGMQDLRHTAVPVKLGERTIGFLLTGQIALDLPSPARFESIARQLTEWELAWTGTGWRTPTTDPGCFRRTNTLVSSAFWKSSANSFPPWQIK
jgi:hypothetical protein